MSDRPRTPPFGRVLRTIQHSVAYARHLVIGNRFSGDMSWTRAGAPPVLLCHGFMGTRGTMLPLTRRFQSDGRVVFSYHHGTFQLRSLRSSAQDLMAQLQRLHKELGVQQFDVVGFSMGGLIALHALKFLQGQRYIRRLALLGTPFGGTWVGLAGVATVGLLSPSVWQVLPRSQFLYDLRVAPLPDGVRVRQIHARGDVLCPNPGPIPGVAPSDYLVLPGGHSSLVVAKPFYARIREFFDDGVVDEATVIEPEQATDPAVAPATDDLGYHDTTG